MHIYTLYQMDIVFLDHDIMVQGNFRPGDYRYKLDERPAEYKLQQHGIRHESLVTIELSLRTRGCQRVSIPSVLACAH